MTSAARRIARDLIPPALTRAIAGRGALRFADGYANWAAAESAAGTYSESSILAQVQAATDRVIAGDAAFERDGVTFDQMEYRWPVVAALLWRASVGGGRLSVLDFGGSLGSSLRQTGTLLDEIDLTWGVVEQPSFVAAGAAYASERLRFFTSVQKCVEATSPTFALLSSVLQYLPDPEGVLTAVRDCGVDTLLIDRTPMTDVDRNIPVVQHVPAQIYRASYPAWLLSRPRLLDALPGWRLVADIDGIEPDMRTTGGLDFRWRGMLMTRGTR